MLIYIYQIIFLPPVMRAWTSHLRGGLLIALMMLRCILALMMCMLLSSFNFEFNNYSFVF